MTLIRDRAASDAYLGAHSPAPVPKIVLARTTADGNIKYVRVRCCRGGRRFVGLLAPLLACGLFTTADDDGLDESSSYDGGYDSGYDSGYEGGYESGMCSGVAYTRTDDPGTAICLDGDDSISCSWGSGNPDVDGTVVDGRFDGSTFGLCFPDGPQSTTCTWFDFSTFFDVDGHDLVLDYLGTRSGEYAQMVNWDAATAGDNGVCGGTGAGSGSAGGGDGGSATCQQACNYDSDCGVGESCLNTASGMSCLPYQCPSCWGAGESCSFNGSTCEFVECIPGDSSDTCVQPCSYDTDCNTGEACLNSADGMICLPYQCQLCWDAGMSCNSNTSTCVFVDCGP